LWSELLFNVPQFFSYSFIKRGHHRMHIDDISGSHSSFTIRANPEFGFSGYERSSDTRLDANITRYRWVMKDVPELKKESYTTTLYNHISRIEFQFASTNYPLVANNYRMTWGSLTNALLEHENFGRALQKDNGWTKDERNTLLNGADSDLEKARRIYAFVRENFTCNDHDAVTVDQSLKNAMKSRKGSVADINLLLISMLRDAGLEADPVILSTTENGYVFELYPIPGAFNYVICQFRSGKKRYYLDASWSGLGFGQLRPFCYNGHARVVNSNIGAVDLSPDSLRESSMTSVFVSNLDNGTWAGTMKHTAGMNESFELRSRITDKGEEAYFTEKVKGFGNDIIMNKQSVTGLKDYDQPLVLEYDFKLKLDGEETIYLSPLFGENYKDNPFKSLVRHYPVEMPYTLDEIFVLTMEVPKGYVVDEVPEQMLVKLDEQGKSFFEYRISHSGEIISLRSRIKIDRASYPADEYDYLREFFARLVSKQSEQIVLKKKK
ncbi:MAG TPA: transglutaminase-like domain-containing protein, partial [Flavisolibacter sp.]